MPEAWVEAWRGLAIYVLTNKYGVTYGDAEEALKKASAGRLSEEVTAMSTIRMLERAGYYLDNPLINRV